MKLRGISSAVYAFLRTNANRRFTASEIADRLGYTNAAVSAVLCAGYAMSRCGLHREEVPAWRARPCYAYWMSDAGEFGGADPTAYRIARWMLRHDKPVRPSIVAEATGVPVGVVARLLEQWAAKGSAVRCELVLRTGYDRFEYRLAASSGINFGNRRVPEFGERLLA